MGEVGELRARFEEAKAKATKRRTFKGYKALLEFEDGGISLSANVRWIKIDSREIDKTIKIYHLTEDGETVEMVENRYVCDECKSTKIKRTWVTPSGRIVDKKKVRHYQHLDSGELIEVEEFKQTKVFRVVGFMDREKLNLYLIESLYEI